MEATNNAVAQAAENVLMTTDTLRGDVRDGLLTIVQTMETPWSKLSERDQQWRIDAIAKLSEKVVRQAVQIVAHSGFPHVAMRTGKWNVGDGIKLEVSGAASVENITRLAEHGQGECILVLAEVGEFFGERRSAHPDPDQRKMDLDGEAGDGVPEMDLAARNAAMIRNAASLAGITIDLGQFPPDQRAGLADTITAAGGRWFNSDAEPEAEAETPAPEKPARGRRRTIRETEAA